MHAGADYQDRVAAWVMVHVLAEQEATPPWDLPSRATLEFLRCETEQPVDDLLVGSSEGGHAFVQVKRRLNLGTSPSSDLRSTFDQFVRQFLSGCDTPSSDRPWDRKLDVDRDRLVLATTSESSAKVRETLPSALDRLRSLSPGQPLEDAATNREEREALGAVLELVKHSWKKAIGEYPTEADVAQVLCLVRVQVLDVDAGGVDERVAKNLLRSSVLRSPVQADLAWSTLIGMCARLASSRSGSDRAGVQRVLVEAEVDVEPSRSYREDIRVLKCYSRSTADSLADLSKIEVGSTEIKIDRRVTKALQDSAEAASLLVVGDPGAGKSGALCDFVKMLDQTGRDVVFMAVNYLKAESTGALRNEVRLSHELDEVLANWPGKEPAFLVLDALDAARSEDSARTFREILSKVARTEGRWRVVASIRKFDLRYGVEVRRLFRGTPPSEFRDSEFGTVRHINVPLLTDEEMAQFGVQSLALAGLLNAADEVLSGLLRVPFNMRLAGELLGEGVSASDLTPIRTQVELLDRYWQERVIRSDDFGDARESLLRLAARRMVSDRALRVDRADISEDTSASPHLKEILSSNILSEWSPSPNAAVDRYILAFSHHVLFDYAAARLLMRGSDQRAPLSLIESGPDLALAIRPSFVFHFQYLWLLGDDHARFWDLVLAFAEDENIPEVGKLIGCGVAVDQGRRISDFDPLLTAILHGDVVDARAAEKALRHVVGAVLVTTQTGSGSNPLAGDSAGPWTALLEKVSRYLDGHGVAPTVRVLLNAVCEQPELLTMDQRHLAGQAARRLLEFAWSHQENAWFTPTAIEAVCRTFESDAAASAELLRRCLEPKHLTERGFGELPYLANEIERLVPLDARLVSDIYQATFTHDEVSEDVTSVGMSNIIPLTSTRRQDFWAARYQLADSFPVLVRKAAAEALRALIAVVDAYAAEQGAPNQHAAETFDFNGRSSAIRTDYSGVWDSGNIYRDDGPLKMLDSFEEHLLALAGDPSRSEERRVLLDIVARENRSAAIWRRVLACGAVAPEYLGREIRHLAWATPILTNIDTTTAAGDFIRAVFTTLARRDREAIEHAILSIPVSLDEDRETAVRMRDRLLGCLSFDALTTDEAKRIRRELENESGPPANEPYFQFGGVTTSAYGEEDYLRDKGVSVDAPRNRRLRELSKPAEEFGTKHLNSAPTLSEAEDVLPDLRALHKALRSTVLNRADPEQRKFSWGHLVAACERIGRLNDLTYASKVGTFAKQVLLEAAEHLSPAPNPTIDAQFDQFPSWGTPAPRIDAAQGLTVIARNPDCADEAVLQMIDRLSRDDVPAVRFQVATRLNALYATAPDLMWDIAERLCTQEQSRGVLRALLNGAFGSLVGAAPERVARLTKAVVDRITDGAGAKEVRELSVSILVRPYVWYGEPLCREVLFEMTDDPSRYSDVAGRLAFNLRGLLRYGPVEPPDPKQDEVRRRAITLVERLTRSTVRGIREMREDGVDTEFGSWPSDHQERYKQLVKVADSLNMEIYFASGAYDHKQQQGELSATVPAEEKRRFLKELGPALDELAGLGFPRLVHHLLETLEFLVDVDPAGIFLRIGRVVRAGERSGYQYESLAAGLIVRLVERYLAEYRFVLRDDPEYLRTLLEILDLFVEAGWPSARRLTYKMEEIFR